MLQTAPIRIRLFYLHFHTTGHCHCSEMKKDKKKIERNKILAHYYRQFRAFDCLHIIALHLCFIDENFIINRIFLAADGMKSLFLLNFQRVIMIHNNFINVTVWLLLF